MALTLYKLSILPFISGKLICGYVYVFCSFYVCLRKVVRFILCEFDIRDLIIWIRI